MCPTAFGRHYDCPGNVRVRGIAQSRRDSDARRVSKSHHRPYIMPFSFRFYAGRYNNRYVIRLRHIYEYYYTVRARTRVVRPLREQSRHARRRRTPHGRRGHCLRARHMAGRSFEKKIPIVAARRSVPYRFVRPHAAHLPRRITYVARRFTCSGQR